VETVEVEVEVEVEVGGGGDGGGGGGGGGGGRRTGPYRIIRIFDSREGISGTHEANQDRRTLSIFAIPKKSRE
jgi:hypothetical protein